MENKRFPADTKLDILTFLNDKQINGELYAYLQGISDYLVIDKNLNLYQTYVSKKKMPTQKKLCEALGIGSPKTLKKQLAYLEERGYIISGDEENKDVAYYLPEMENIYFLIPTGTLQYLNDNCKEHVIKIYIYLGQRYKMALEEGRQYTFTLKEMRQFVNKKCGYDVYTRMLTKSRRYSDDVSSIIENLTTDIPHKTKIVSDYSINIYCAKEEFMNSYDNAKGNKKMYVPYTIKSNGIITILGRDMELAAFTENSFSAYENFDPNYIGHTLHALSFDVDDAFIYLPTVKLVKSDSKNKLYYKENTESPVHVKKFMNELNILFSRGRKSLNIYVGDIKVYLFLKSRLPK